MIQQSEITGLILAGGRGMRMGQVNKGLQELNGKTMVAHVIEKLLPQVSTILINANQDLDRYAEYGFPVITDTIADYAGPLAGLESALSQCQTKYLLSTPCDSPFLPSDLASRLASAMTRDGSQLAVPITHELFEGKLEKQIQPVFCLLERNLHESLADFLKNGGRKISDWFDQLRISEVVFENHDEFSNINTKAELAAHAKPPAS